MGTRAAGDGAPALIWTKLHPPVERALVPRPDLLELLRGSATTRLTLIRAPAGWGKSSLLASWHAAESGERPVAWLQLDGADNDPVRFWSYVVHALREVEPTVGDRAETLLRAPGTSVADDVLPLLINEAAALPSGTVLVLDDYHAIKNREIHEALDYLVEHLPPELRLMLGTRTEPPLSLPRLRARGELLEIDAALLRFSEDESGLLLNGLQGLHLSTDEIARLCERTEGWPAGLYLAGLSLVGRAEASAFIESFAGDDRLVVDYLSAEVLGGQPPHVRDFLLQTSILDRLSGPLSDAVVDGAGSTRLLAEIERSNSFLVPLDTRREWYRYHHLFRELLRHELTLAAPDVLPLLHTRAATWLLEAGFVSEATHHFTAADDHAAAADLVADQWNGFLNHGRLETVVGWLDGLPSELVRSDPRLCLARAATSLTLGRKDDCERWLAAAEDAGERGAAPVGARSVEAEVMIYGAVNCYRSGELEEAARRARRAVALERDDRSPWQAMALAALGRSLYWQGKTTEARDALAEAARHAEPGANTLSVIGALGYLGLIEAEQGRLDSADARVGEAVRLGDEQSLGEHWVMMMALAAQGEARIRRGDLPGAEQALERAVVLGRRGAGPIEMAFCLLARADARWRRGGTAEAAQDVAEAQAALDGCPEKGILAAALERVKRNLGLHRPPSSRRGSHADEVTERELAVLRLLAGELSLGEIGSSLYVSRNTVKTHVKNIYRKLAVSTRSEAVARARELGLI